MWTNFYAAGGWGMYPVSLMGFFLIVSSVLFALRPGPRGGKLVLVFGVVTFASGLLGATVGICNSAHFIPQVDPSKQLEILALGFEESLHDVVLALMLVVVAGLISAVGTLRGSAAPSATAGA
jgi:hypothetical protein